MGRRIGYYFGRKIEPRDHTRIQSFSGELQFFRSYQRNLLGRVNLKTNQVECLMLPVQMQRTMTGDDRLLWGPEGSLSSFKTSKKPRSMLQNEWAIEHNKVKNSRGLVVMGDDRS